MAFFKCCNPIVRKLCPSEKLPAESCDESTSKDFFFLQISLVIRFKFNSVSQNKLILCVDFGTLSLLVVPLINYDMYIVGKPTICPLFLCTSLIVLTGQPQILQFRCNSSKPAAFLVKASKMEDVQHVIGHKWPSLYQISDK